MTKPGVSYFSLKAFILFALSSLASANLSRELTGGASPFPLFLLGIGAEMLSVADASDLSFLDFLV